MKADRVVIDTNVLISAAIMPLGKPKAVFVHVVGNSRLIMSRELFLEFADRLSRPKFSKYIDHEQKQSFLVLLEAAAEFVEISGAPQGVRDPQDDMVLETAIAAGADCLVTGDEDLLVLRPAGPNPVTMHEAEAVYRDVAILRPAEFLSFVDRVRGSGNQN